MPEQTDSFPASFAGSLRAEPPILRGGPEVAGSFRRRIVLDAREVGTVRADLEDDFHHFGVQLSVADGRIRQARGVAHRFPWTTCPGAVARLEAFEGLEIGPAVLRRRDLPDILTHCTHLHELTVLAAAQGGRGGMRVYEADVADRTGRTRFPFIDEAGAIRRPQDGTDGRTTARLRRDSVVVAEWAIDDDRLVSPAAVEGHTLWTVMKAASVLDDDGLESARILRRCLHLAGARIMPLHAAGKASLSPGSAGVCFTFQPDQAPKARRTGTSARDFTDHPQALLSALAR